ncbi:MAG TPA: hypothetical protein DD727_04875, partial [Clostridiales bacterium]|nr:hypothetical protein [Clostridiales bacterium]
MNHPNAERPRVLFLIPTLDDGGAERVASTLSVGLGDRVEIHLLLHDARRVHYPYKGVVYGLDAPGGRFRPIRVILNQVHRIRKIRKFKAEHRITAAVSFFEPSNLYNILTRGSERVILTVHNQKSAEARGSASFRGKMAEWMYKPLIRRLYPRADRVVAVSRGVACDLADRYGLPENRIGVIPNALPVKTIQSMAHSPLPPEHAHIFEHPVLIHAGRLAPQKGHIHLFRAFRIIREVLPDLSLVLLGEGPLEERLKCRARELGIEEN